jgi:2-dehydro-3-deoxyphosphogalactonate aldolase
MKIVDVTTYAVAVPPPHKGGYHWVFLKLTTDEGISGFGEAHWVPFRPPAVVHLMQDMGERFVIGSDPFRIEKLWQTLYASDFGQHPDLTKLGVITAFEMACWDIVGKALNQPIYNLLGGQIWERLRSYTYLYPTPDHPSDANVHADPKLAAESAAYHVEQGFTAVKYDPITQSGITPRQLSLEELDNSEAVTESVRNAVGSKCDILIGTHGQMTTSSAIRLAQRLEKFDPLWFEEPVPPENVDEMARVARSTKIPIATGERLSTKYEFAELLVKQAAQILQMDMGRVGGILEAKKIAGMAEAHYAQIAPHLWCGPISWAAAIQLDACSPNFLIQEGIEMWGGFYAEIVKEPPCWEDGCIIPPTGPGLGVELDEEVAVEHAYSASS